MMSRLRDLFLLLLLIGLATCQRQGELTARNYPSNQVYRNANNDQQIRGVNQQSDSSLTQQTQYQQSHDTETSSVEDFEDEDYYDDEPTASIAADQKEPRELKTSKTESAQGNVNATVLYDDEYYYDNYEDDVEEPEVNEKEKDVRTVQVPISTTTTRTTTTTTTTKAPKPTTQLIRNEESGSSISPEGTSTEKVVLETSSSKSSILIGEAIVSVVTTKSVVNGTFSVPDFTTVAPLEPTEEMSKDDSIRETTDKTTSTTDLSPTKDSTTAILSSSTSTSTSTLAPPSSTTIHSAVQTGRSVSGARYLPFAPVQDKIEQLDSTESIIDKLDRVQSELLSGFLPNSRFVPRRYNKKPFSVTSLTIPTTTTTQAPTSSPIAPITITSITKRPRAQTTLDDISAFLPKDFKNSIYRTSTTPAPLTKRPKVQTTLDDIGAFLPKDFSSTKRPKLQTTLDDLDGLLPKDFPKSRFGGYKRPSYKTTTASSASITAKSTTEKSTGSTRPKTLTTIEDIAAFLPPGYKLRKEDATTEKSVTLSEALGKIKAVPKEGSTLSPSTTERAKSIQDLFAKSAVDVSALLPPGYKPDANSPKVSTEKPAVDPIQELLIKSSVDISALLPSGYKAESAKSTKSIKSSDPVQELVYKSNADISPLLPPGFKENSSSDAEESTDDSSTKTSGGSFKVVFPSRPGGRKPIQKITTPSSRTVAVGEPASPKIQKGWPIRATTEFTGWPTSSTTPISIEKLLEAARTATVSSLNSSLLPTTSEVSSTSSTTTTTTTTVRPTTPGICDEDCEVAGTIKIVENATWVPELLDRNTQEWQDLAEEIEREMNLVFAKSPVLRKWFRNIRIDSFSQGSVLVDYFVELTDLKEKINTQQLKVIFHDSLRTFNYDDPMEATPKGPTKLGKFTIDPKSTDFVVIPRVQAPKMLEDENRLIPQWAIAVIVIGVGGLLFIIVFGVSVLVNRQHGSKLKPSISAIYEEEVAKNAMMVGHAAASRPPAADYNQKQEHQMWSDVGWHDKPFESTSHKILVDGPPYERKYNPYDSWKSEWNGYYYPPTHASSSHYPRHHPDYDINF